MTGDNVAQLVKIHERKEQLRKKIAELSRALAQAEQELQMLEQKSQKDFNYSWVHTRKPDDPIPQWDGSAVGGHQ